MKLKEQSVVEPLSFGSLFAGIGGFHFTFGGDAEALFVFGLTSR